MSNSQDATFEEHESLDEADLIEDHRPTTHVDLPDPDDPDPNTEGDTGAPPKPWKRLRRDTDPEGI